VGDVKISLKALAVAAKLGNVKGEQVIYHLMNDVVAPLVKVPVRITNFNEFRMAVNSGHAVGDTPASTLTHASEKAKESVFHLFHLLLCLAAEEPQAVKDTDNAQKAFVSASSQIVEDANQALKAFLNGATSKTECPDIGHLFADLISSYDMTVRDKEKIITEVTTRDVLPLLNKHPELSHPETLTTVQTTDSKSLFMQTCLHIAS
jgi:hypothetical protein